MFKTIIISCITFLLTSIMAQILVYIKNTGKKAKIRKEEDLKNLMRETIREEIEPIKSEICNLKKEITSINDDNQLIKSGLQFIIKVDLQSAYNEWIVKGYAPLHIKNELEKLYWVYHNLGKNGIMDSLRE